MTTVDHVVTWSSFRYAVEPRAFDCDGTRHEVTEISWSWRTPGRIHFAVKDDEGRATSLTYSEADGKWFLEETVDLEQVNTTSTKG